MLRYSREPTRNQSLPSIPYSKMAVVLADARARCFSPALSCALSAQDSPALRAVWTTALTAHGIEAHQAAAFVQRVALRTNETLQEIGSITQSADNLKAAA